MTNPTDFSAQLVDGAEPPRRNGEIVFAAPWERRVFGLTMALCQSGTCEWETFRQRLIKRIAENEARPYWESWSAALEDVVATESLLTQAELNSRHREFLERPAGHDHTS